MQAGTLEIELLANVAQLQQDMEQVKRSVGNMTDDVGRKARAANDNLRGIGRGAGANIVEFSREVARLKGQIDPAWASLQRYKDQVRLLQRALAEGAITHKQFVAEMRAAVAGYRDAGDEIVEQSGAMRAGWQNASFQVSDFAVQVGGGTSAIRAASQQAPQLIQALAMMGAGADQSKGKFAAFTKFMGGPWGAAITVGVSILGALATQFLSAGDEAEKADAKIENLTRQFDFASMSAQELADVNALLADANAEIERTAIGAANATRIKAEADRDAAKAALLHARAEYERIAAFSNDPTFAEGNLAYGGQLGRLQTKIDGLTTAIDGFDKQANRSRFNVDLLTADLDENGRAAEKLRQTIDTLRLLYQESGDSRFLENALRLQEQINALEERPGRKTRSRLSDAEKAQKKQTEETLRFIEALELEIAQIGLTEGELRQLEISQAKASAQTKAERDRIEELNIARETAISTLKREEAIRTNSKAVADFENNVLKPMREELALMGLIGPERELAALALEEEAFKAAAAKKGIIDVNKAWEDYLLLKTTIINRESAFQRDIDAARILNDQLRDMIGLLGGLGGVGGAIGGLLGLATGNTSAVGGVFGEILNTPTGRLIDEIGPDGRKTGKLIGQTIGDELREIFKLEGEFGKTMASLLQGSGTGLIAGSAFGFDGTGGQLGSAIGGALGQELGEKFLSKGLESIASGLGGAAGPIGAIAGGLLGGVIGGLFSSTPRGSATIGGVDGALGVTSTRGNSQARIAAATKSANSIIDGLENLAAELGATIDPSLGSVSIGIRKGNYRVDTTGQGITKTKRGAVDFGEDAEAAAYFAMLDLIKDGVLQGLRAGTETLLKNSEDLESGIAKALAFEGVFKDLAAIKDPLGAALDNLQSEFDRLRTIFEEAGAAAEEFADLEELLAIKRQEIIDRQAQETIDKLSGQNSLEVQMLQLLGREEDALALARLNELSATEKALRPMQALVYQLQDARAVIEQFQPLADSLRAYKEELQGGSSAGGFGFLSARFQETAALARSGDAAALASLQKDASAFLDAAKANAATELEYRRAIGQVMGAVDDGIFAADAQVEYAQLQIDAIAENTDVLTQLKSELATYQQRLIDQGEWVQRLFRRWDGDGLLVRTDEDTPLLTETAP